MNRREFLKNIGKLSVLIPFLSWNKEDIDRAGMLIFDEPLGDRDYQSAKNAFTSRNDQMAFTMLSLDDYAKVIGIKIW